MTNTSQEFNTAPIYEFISRSLGILVPAVTIFLGDHLGIWTGNTTILLICCAIYPVIILLLSLSAHLRNSQLRRPLFITLDAIWVGFFIAYFQFAAIPCLVLLIMVNTSIMSLGSVKHWMTSMSALVVSLYASVQFQGFNPTYESPFLIDIAAIIAMAAHFIITSFYNGRQNNLLAQLHEKLRAEQSKQQSLSLKVAKYISPQIWESIFSGNKEVKLETQRKKLVVFFSDIKGFTALSEQLESEDLTELLNNYLTEMTNIALKYGGTIDKYIGDSIMVFFGDPKTQGAKKDTLACVAMAIEMRKHMKVLRQQWRQQGVKTPLEIRMGINTGYCTVGNFGTESRMDYTIIGREVNMASRLESAAEAGEILISQEAYALVQDKIICREKGSISAKGFSRPVPVYEAVDFRHNLAAKSSFIEHELPGFSMYMDTNRINNYDREKIAKALEKAAHKIKDEAKMQG